MSMANSIGARKGVALIVSISILLALSALGVTFAKLTNYERALSNNFVASFDARSATQTGINQAIAVLSEQIRLYGYVHDSGILYPHAINSQYYNDLKDTSAQGQNISLQQGTVGTFSYSGMIGYPKGTDTVGRYETNGNFYSLKIVNLAGKLNLNSHISPSSLQQYSNSIMNRILRSLAASCNILATEVNKVADALRDPNSSNRPDYRSMDDVEQIIEDCCPASLESDKRKFLNNLCIYSWIDPKTACAIPATPIALPPVYYSEQRAPIDVNSASNDLLAALVANIKARVVFFDYDGVTAVDADITPDTGESQSQTETSISHTLYPQDIDFSGANITNIVNTITTVPGTQTRITHYGVVESNIETISNSDLPSFPVGTLPNSLQTEWYQACKDALKSNFNPNTTDNFWIPNKPVYYRVVKANLYDEVSSVPHHTTELCFCSKGRFEITSVGRITAWQGTVVDMDIIRTSVSLYDVLQHTTQQDFISGNFYETSSAPGMTSETISYPQTVKQLATNVDRYAGRVEPTPLDSESQSPMDTPVLYESPDVTDKITAPTSLVTTKIEKVTNFDTMKATDVRVATGDNHVVNDGIFSRTIQYADVSSPSTLAIPRYYALPAVENTYSYNGTTFANVLKGRGNLHNFYSGESRVANNSGSVEFWIKLDNDASEKIFCGLMSFTQISYERSEVSPEDGITMVDFKEGTATYLYKNTLGQLRLSRIYFCGFFDKAENYYGTLYHLHSDWENRKFARRDVLVDISTWKAHTWHHLMVTWDDTTETQEDSLIIWADGTKYGSKYRYGDVATSTCPQCTISSDLDTQLKAAMNHSINGMDSFFINGFYRCQHSNAPTTSPAALFRHGQEIHQVGNATIDRVISYKRQLSNPIRGRYLGATRYSNTFTIPTGKKGILGPLKWTAFPTRSSIPSSHTKPYITCSATLVGNPAVTYTYSGGSSSAPGYYGEGLPTNTLGSVQGGDKVTYTASFYNPSHSILLANAEYNGSVCAALDSVELIFICPEVLSLEYLY